ncbi:MAG TPA: amidohydrolase family protein [Dermatophilaceae bacterium]|nr:amidohydrolase family protein [Dermatophilaceae bacterium]
MGTLYRGGFVYSPADPFATAMLVRDGVVAWVGSDEAAGTHADTGDQVVDLDGALVTPAFVDAHAHLSQTGLALRGLDVSRTSSLAEALDRVERAARAGRGRPLYVHSWEESRWPERRPPTAAELDRAAYGGSVYMPRIDGHCAAASSALLAASGARGLDGWTDTGLVTRAAHHAVRAAFHAGVPPASRREDIATALAAAAAAGIGLVHEHAGPLLSSREDLADVLAAGQGGQGPRTVGYWAELVSDPAEATRLVGQTGARGLAGDLVVDGSLGSRTASLREPYADATGRGSAYLNVEQVRNHVVACTLAGVQAGFHVIGDAGVDTAVAGLRAAAWVVGAPAIRAARHRLEHVEMADADAIATLAGLGVVASVQPAFDAAWGGDAGMYAARLGPRRAATMNPFAAMAAAGVLLALGSDTPVTPFAPWEAVRACVRHHQEAQRISARSAFLAHTRGGWRAAGVDDRGVLGPGQPATFAVWEVGDLVVQAPDDRVQTWSTDPRSGTPGLPDLSADAPVPACLRTVVDGVIVHDLDGALG